MSSKEKLLIKIQNGPRNVRFNDLKKLMGDYGFSTEQSKDGLRFKHAKLRLIINVPKPHGREKKVHKCYVDECLIAIEQLEDVKNKGD